MAKGITMHSEDIMDQNNNRAEAIRWITKLCDEHGYSYRYTEKKFSITLPVIESIPITNSTTKRGKLIQELDMSIFGPDSGYHEDELPPVDTTLEEGGTK